MKQLTISLKPEELNVILNALVHLPYMQVHEIIEKLKREAGPQLLAIQEAKEKVRENTR